jgi:nitric oxide reductase activation protein
LTTKHGELTTLWPHSTLNKITSQSTYPDLPTTGAIYKRDKITLPKAVAKENNRGSIASVQKAGRASVKKRVAEEQARENGAGENGARGGESGDQVEGRAPKRARVARRSGRHV